MSRSFHTNQEAEAMQKVLRQNDIASQLYDASESGSKLKLFAIQQHMHHKISNWLLYSPNFPCKIDETTKLFQGALMTVVHEWRRGEYFISTDKRLLDLQAIHSFLTASYWAQGIPFETVKRSIEHSLNFGVYKGEKQVGFARVITDYATYAYIGDVYILEEYRGQGLSKWLMQMVADHPELQGLRRWSLLTRDAHGLYRQTGFAESQHPERYMEKIDLDVYKTGGV
jgi:GNAT superfamily N-acetyltransferase